MTIKHYAKRYFLGIMTFFSLGISSLWLIRTRRPQLIKPIQGIEQHTNIIFDLNDVLFTINRKEALRLLGFKDVVLYILGGRSADHIEQKIIDIIHEIDPTPKTVSSDELEPLHKGRPLPLMMREWMKGTITSQELIDKTQPHIERLDQENFFVSKREKRIIEKAIMALLDPATRCKLYRPIKDGINLIKRCKKMGHKVYLLSNMDTELITLLKEKHPMIFDLFDGTIISANINTMKPYKDIFEYTLTTYNMDPEKSYFIDDQMENITGAQQVGITGIHCNFHKYRNVTKQMSDLGIFTPDTTTKTA